MRQKTYTTENIKIGRNRETRREIKRERENLKA